MRLDKFLCQMNLGTRAEVRQLIRRRQVSVNGVTAVSGERQIDEGKDRISCKGHDLAYQSHVYYMLNKPRGVVSATRDDADETVLDLLLSQIPERHRNRNIVPAGRLDKDTEGLMLLTDDGALVHELLSPKRHVDKTYLVHTANELSGEDIRALATGVDIGERRDTLPAKVKVLDQNRMLLTICEGKYHQIKRMLQAVNNEVLSLTRLRFGNLSLDESLAPGTCRELSEAEIFSLRCRPPALDDVDAVIFDLDGTLVDSMWIWRQIDVEYLGKFGIPLPEGLQTAIEGKSFHETAIYFKERFAIPDSLDKIKENWNAMAWEKYEREVPLKPGVMSFLSDCKARGVKLGIATSNSRALMENIADVHGLRDYFDCMLTGCDVYKGKPAPDIYLAVAERLGVKPGRCLVFEDIIPGIMAGRNAGMKVCAVEDAYSAGVRVQKRELADYYIADYGILTQSDVY